MTVGPAMTYLGQVVLSWLMWRQLKQLTVT